MQELLGIMRRLRAPDGCPWDQEQTHETLRPYLLEEAAEAADAVSLGAWDELPSELGDVLLQVAFHSVIAEEAGTFSYAEVERSIVEKLVRRHPHVFGDVNVSGSGEVVSNWQAIKVQERGGRERTVAEQIPSALGALAREAQAQKLTGQPKTAAQDVADVLAATEQNEGEQSIGRLLAAVVAYSRRCGVDPEVALRTHTAQRLAEAQQPETRQPGTWGAGS
ncbi:MazG family protein [Deinococcus altitudinis]|uniref:MazG family protein n=1 Tax=Deinococcus altitudinis TaxID=468914 RepID=UPI003891E607